MILKPVTTTKDSEQLLAVTKDGGLHLGRWKDGRFVVIPTSTGGIELRRANIAHVYEVTNG